MEKQDFENVTKTLTDNIIFCMKDVLTAKETARYMGISLSYLHKLTMKGQIPYYKPSGKMLYFNREEVEAWLMSNRCETKEELEDRARKFCLGRDVPKHGTRSKVKQGMEGKA